MIWKGRYLSALAASALLGAAAGSAHAQSDTRIGVATVPLEPVTGDLSVAASADGTRSFDGFAIREDVQFLRDPKGYYHCDDDLVHGAREVCLDLTIGYGTSRIYNPFAHLEHGRDFDTVRLRSYIPTQSWLTDDPDEPGSATTRFLAPELRITPGQTVRLTLRNQLPLPGDADIPGLDGQKCGELPPPPDSNTPHCINFNRTNLHSHGLWISPTGNSDNVHISIDAGETFQYEYNVPADHPAGTFWYHSHLHGSTAAQVASGMAGAIIIKGDRNPIPDGDGGWARAGDVDVLLSNAARDRTILLQQLSYGCRNAQGELTDTPAGGFWRDCGDEVGMLEPGALDPFDQFAPGSWPNSRRFTSINGAVWPVLGLAAEPGPTESDESIFHPAVAGTVERWRFIHAGVRNTLQIQFRKANVPPQLAEDEPAVLLAALQEREVEAMRSSSTTADPSAETDVLSRNQVVTEICPEPGGGGGDPLTVFGIASDGLTRNEISTQQNTFLQPGYREDLLVVFPEPGIYCIIEARAPDRTLINTAESDEGLRHGRDLLGYVIVNPAPDGTNTVEVTDLEQLAGWLSEQARTVYGSRIQDTLSAAALIDAITLALGNSDEDGARPLLTPFVHHPDVADEEVTDADGNLRLRTVAFHAQNLPVESDGPAVGVASLVNRFHFMVGRIGQTGSFEEPDANGNFNGRFVFWDGEVYDHNRIDQELTLDRAEEWWLTSFALGPHPYHIHVNPFRIEEALVYRRPNGCNLRSVEGNGAAEQVADDPRPGCQIDEGNRATWVDVSQRGSVLAVGQLPLASTDDPDQQRELDMAAVAPSQYAGYKGVWRDTLAAENFVLVRIRSRYQRYIGDFVLHCHILDHEDQGMMQNVRISLAVGRPGEDVEPGEARAHGGGPLPGGGAHGRH